jgi:hypothetical protein
MESRPDFDNKRDAFTNFTYLLPFREGELWKARSIGNILAAEKKAGHISDPPDV